MAPHVLARLDFGLEAMEGGWHAPGFEPLAPTHGMARCGAACLGEATLGFGLGSTREDERG